MLAYFASAALTLALVLSGPAHAQDSKEKVNKLRADYIAAFNSGQAESLAKLFAEDAVYLPASGERVEGRKAIEQSLHATFKEGASDLKVEPRDTQQLGNAYYDSGTYSFSVSAPQGQKQTVRGNYLVLIQSASDGSLLIKYQIANMVPGDRDK
jgi:uncharacterized protein (TIGR02246 family)